VTAITMGLDASCGIRDQSRGDRHEQQSCPLFLLSRSSSSTTTASTAGSPTWDARLEHWRSANKRQKKNSPRADSSQGETTSTFFVSSRGHIGKVLGSAEQFERENWTCHVVPPTCKLRHNRNNQLFVYSRTDCRVVSGSTN
jgi:hypothetical protein